MQSFDTRIAMDDLNKSGRAADIPVQIPLTLWFIHRPTGVKITDYTKHLLKLQTMHTCDEFWNVYCHLNFDLPPISDIHFFRKDITPTWESSEHGGKWSIRIVKQYSRRFYEVLLLSLCSGQLSALGLVLSIRHTDDVVSVWFNDIEDRNLVKDQICALTHVHYSALDYKAHLDAYNKQA
eukprot:NODE_378_length_9766_cov_0.333816.p5 type:complete len:180 gc:universal NODE_378_length_9766_cov_0.333816:8681-8142(-)